MIDLRGPERYQSKAACLQEKRSPPESSNVSIQSSIHQDMKWISMLQSSLTSSDGEFASTGKSGVSSRLSMKALITLDMLVSRHV